MSCYVSRTTPEEIIELWPKDCTIKDYISKGHSDLSKCSEYFDLITACVIISPPGTSLNFVNTGCSTFQNRDEVMKHAEDIRKIISKRCKVIVTGQQDDANADGICSSLMTVTITCDKITVGYGPCHREGKDFCFKESINNTIRCTNEQGQVVSEVCCETGKQIKGLRYGLYYRDGEPVTSAWFRGTKCESSPPPDGLCLGEARRYWCSGAKKDALTEANKCLNKEQETCNGNGQTFIREACTTQTWDGVGSGGLLWKCSARATCPWQCVNEQQYR